MSNTHDQGPRDTDTGASRDAGSVSTEETSARETGRRYVPRPAPHYESTSSASGGAHGAAIGFTLAAAVLMMLSGAWNFLEGIAAVVRGAFFTTQPNYAFDLSVHSWGWFHLILGAVVFVAGAALFLDKWWARAIGVLFAGVSTLVNFLYIPYQPAFSIVIMAIDVVIIWALLTPRRRRA